jgi:hypothetical protein
MINRMVKEKSLAASVPWAELEGAIQANPQRSTPLFGRGAVRAVQMQTAEKTVPWLPGWNEDTAFSVSDAVSLVLWIKDPLYRSATTAVRHAMEMEEASTLLNTSEDEWRRCNGRVRGWVRKHLEEDLRGRSAGEPALPDVWNAIRTNKRAGLLMDYICIINRVRVALWWPEHNAVTVYPLTGGTGPIVQVNCDTGHILMNAKGWSVPADELVPLLSTAEANASFRWIAPTSAPALSGMTVSQLQEQIAALQKQCARTIVSTGNRQTLINTVHWATLLCDFGKSIKSDVKECDLPLE